MNKRYCVFINNTGIGNIKRTGWILDKLAVVGNFIRVDNKMWEITSVGISDDINSIMVEYERLKAENKLLRSKLNLKESNE